VLVVLVEPQVLIVELKVPIQGSTQLFQLVGDMEREVLSTHRVDLEVQVAVDD
jgi:hypothetical protein